MTILSWVGSLVAFVPLCFMASDGKVQASNREGVPDIYDVMLNRVLMFAAGATVELPIGFLPKPTITFQCESPLPRTNTCTNTIHLPLEHKEYEQFKYHILYGIFNDAGLGQV